MPALEPDRPQVSPSTIGPPAPVRVVLRRAADAAPQHEGRGVDFVVVGFGIGALAVLLGLLLRDAAGWWWRLGGRSRTERDRLALGAFLRTGGRLLALAGAALCLLTLLALLLGFSDAAGALLVTLAVTAAALGLAAWAAAQLRRAPLRVARPRPALAAPVPLAVAIEQGVARDGQAGDDWSPAGAEAMGAPPQAPVEEETPEWADAPLPAEEAELAPAAAPVDEAPPDAAPPDPTPIDEAAEVASAIDADAGASEAPAPAEPAPARPARRLTDAPT